MIASRLFFQMARTAIAWHGLYPPGFADILNGRRPWQSLSSLRREALDNVMRERGINSFGGENPDGVTSAGV
jgi:2-haloacid dehalogenase